MNQEICLKSKKLQVLKTCDVIVVGGSFAGVCAAIGAARAGANTVLIERNGCLGGQAAEIDTWGLDGFVDELSGRQFIRGLPWEIMRRTVEEGGSDPLWSRVYLPALENEGIAPALKRTGLRTYVPYMDTGTFMNPFNDQYINPGAYRYVIQTMLAEAGVNVLIDNPVVDTILEDQTVQGVVIQCEFAQYAILGTVTVDATQQAQVCANAGPAIKNRQVYMGTLPRVANIDISKLLYYIENTPDQWLLRPMRGKPADVAVMRELVAGGNPLAIHGFEHDLQKAIEADPNYLPLWRKPQKQAPAADSEETPLWRKTTSQLMFFYERDRMGAYWAFGDDFDRVQADDPLAMSQAILAGRRQQWLMHKFFTRYIPGFEQAHLVDVYPDISKAYEQSFDSNGFTEYDITSEEIVSGVSVRPDIILRVKGHPRGGQNATGWLLPYASLIPKQLDGILVTGKPVNRKIHYIVTCAAVGQAAGVAAAVAAISGSGVRSADTTRIVAELTRQDAIVL